MYIKVRHGHSKFIVNTYKSSTVIEIKMKTSNQQNEAYNVLKLILRS